VLGQLISVRGPKHLAAIELDLTPLSPSERHRTRVMTPTRPPMVAPTTGRRRGYHHASDRRRNESASNQPEQAQSDGVMSLVAAGIA
jgi:hypothetical protein